MLLVFLNMGLLSTSFTTYFPHMQQIKGYTNTQLYLLPTIRSVAVIVFTAFSDTYYRRLGIRKGVALTLILPIIGFVLLSVGKAFWVYELVMILFGFSYAIGATIPAALLIRQWFPEHTAKALGIATAGSGISFIFLPLYVDHFVEKVGLDQTLLMEAGFVAVVGLVLILLIRENPEAKAAQEADSEKNSITDKDALPAENAGSNAAQTSRSLTPKTGVLTRFLAASGGKLTGRQEFLLYLSFILIGALCLTAVSGLSMLYSTTGHSVEDAAHLMSIFGFTLIAGKLIYGTAADKVGSLKTNAICCGLLIAGHLLNCLSQNAPFGLLVAACAVCSFGSSIATVGMSVIARDMSHPEAYPKMLRNVQLIYSIGGVISGPLPGVVADLTGSYVPAYYGFLALAVILPLLLLPLYRKKAAS